MARWSGTWMDAFAQLNGIVGSLAMLGAVVALVPVALGAASVLYTFYPPAVGNPFFYVGIVLVVLLALLGKVPVRYNVRNLQVRWLTTLARQIRWRRRDWQPEFTRGGPDDRLEDAG